MSHSSHIEINQKKLHQNIKFMKSNLQNSCRYSAVIKGNAYGHGIKDIVPIMEDCGVNHFSVFSIEEAKEAQEVKRIATDIMIMGFINHDELKWAIQNDVSFYVFTFSRLEASIAAAKALQKPAKIHIEVETGMNRTGFRKAEFEKAIEIIEKNKKHLEIEGICSHLAGAENISNYDRITDQIKCFHQRVERFKAANIHPKYRHLACSAAVLNFPETQLDLVRVGIANYGYWPSDELKMNHLLKKHDFADPLKAVLSWKSTVMSIEEVPENEYISYGKFYLTNRPSKIVSVPVGYGYGFSRALSNLGRVLINNKRLPVVGLINMNMFLVDATDLPNVKEGDEVVIIGEQGDLKITVSSFSDMSNSLNYELLTRLPQDIPRLMV